MTGQVTFFAQSFQPISKNRRIVEMKKALISAVFFLIVAGTSFAAEFGPPEPFDKTLVPSVGYTYSEANFTSSRHGWDDATVIKRGIFLQGSLLLSDDSEGYLRVGGADWEVLDFKSADTGQYVDFHDSPNVYTTLGYKRKFYEARWFGMGTFLQGSYFTNRYRDTSDAVDEITYENYWDLNLGLSAQAKLEPDLGPLNEAIFYGGPFYYFASAKATVEYDDDSNSYSTNIDEDGNLGFFSGLRIRMPGGMYAGVEGRYKTELSGGLMLSMFF